MKRVAMVVCAIFLGLGLARPAAAVTVTRVVSAGGIEAWLVEDHSSPILSMIFSFDGGAALDPSGKEGLATMVAGLLDEGAGDLKSQDFQSRLDDLAASFTAKADDDALRGEVKTTTANRAAAFDLVRLALTRPRFDADAVERVRGQLVAELARQQGEPSVVAQRAFAAMVFGQHPYGRPAEGTPAGLAAITVADLKDWVGQRFGRDHLIIGVAGDITAAELGPLLDTAFGDLPASVADASVSDTEPGAPGRVVVLRRQIPQSVAVFGEPGVKRDDPDWYAAFVMNSILGGGGFSSRLTNEVRVKRGLAYGAASYLIPNDHAALIEGEVATRNERMADSLAVIKREWQRMADDGVTAEELADAKTYLNGSFPLQMDGTASIARLLVVVQRDHLGIDYFDRRASLINAVSVDDVHRVARRLLHADQLAVVVVGDPTGVEASGQ